MRTITSCCPGASVVSVPYVRRWSAALSGTGDLADRIVEQIGHNVSPAERRSWSHSLAVLGQDLADAGLGQVEMLVEYQLPLTSKRVDVVLAGVDHPGRPRTPTSSWS